MHNFSVSPSTIIAISHRRDLDEIITSSTLHISKTIFRPRFRMWFATREDVFAQGFLSSHFRLPRFLAHPLSVINLSAVMAAFRAQPIGRLNRNHVGAILRNVHKCEGNVALKEVFRKEMIEEFARIEMASGDSDLGDIRLKDFLTYGYHNILALNGDFGMLKDDVSKRARIYQLEKIDRQLSRLSTVLDGGGILLFTPQDDHSEDGRFVPIRSGLYRLICMAQAEVRVLPVNIDYDFMTVGRMRIHVTIGTELTNLKGLTKSEFEKLIKRSITRLGVVNMGRVGSHCLLQLAQDHSESVSREKLAQGILSQAQQLRSIGLSVNNVFMRGRSFGKHLDRFIKYCIRRRWLADGNCGELIINRKAVLDSSSTDHEGYNIRYCYNELLTCQCAIDPGQKGVDISDADNEDLEVVHDSLN